MQAYARAELTPLESDLPLVPRAAGMQAVPLGVDDRVATRLDRAATSSSLLASLILDGLDDHGLAVLARRLLPFLQRADEANIAPVPAAYTVATLANELDVSQKAIRCAIARRELAAVKRGSRWIIPADAVRAWSTAPARPRKTRRSCGLAAPKSAGPSLRSVFCAGASRGSSR